MFFCVFQVFWYLRLPEVAAIAPMVTFAGPGDVNSHAGCLFCTGRLFRPGGLLIKRIVVGRVRRFFLAPRIDDESDSA